MRKREDGVLGLFSSEPILQCVKYYGNVVAHVPAIHSEFILAANSHMMANKCLPDEIFSPPKKGCFQPTDLLPTCSQSTCLISLNLVPSFAVTVYLVGMCPSPHHTLSTMKEA